MIISFKYHTVPGAAAIGDNGEYHWVRPNQMDGQVTSLWTTQRPRLYNTPTTRAATDITGIIYYDVINIFRKNISKENNINYIICLNIITTKNTCSVNAKKFHEPKTFV
jgi:hypothetical protein